MLPTPISGGSPRRFQVGVTTKAIVDVGAFGISVAGQNQIDVGTQLLTPSAVEIGPHLGREPDVLQVQHRPVPIGVEPDGHRGGDALDRPSAPEKPRGVDIEDLTIDHAVSGPGVEAKPVPDGQGKVVRHEPRGQCRRVGERIPDGGHGMGIADFVDNVAVLDHGRASRCSPRRRSPLAQKSSSRANHRSTSSKRSRRNE